MRSFREVSLVPTRPIVAVKVRVLPAYFFSCSRVCCLNDCRCCRRPQSLFTDLCSGWGWGLGFFSVGLL